MTIACLNTLKEIIQLKSHKIHLQSVVRLITLAIPLFPKGVLLEISLILYLILL